MEKTNLGYSALALYIIEKSVEDFKDNISKVEDSLKSRQIVKEVINFFESETFELFAQDTISRDDLYLALGIDVEVLL